LLIGCTVVGSLLIFELVVNYATRRALVKNRQNSANNSEKSKRLARIRQKVALRDDLAKDRGKASQTGTSESHDDISTSLKVKTKTIRVLLDTGSSGDLLFIQKGKMDIPIVKRAVPQSWNTSNGTFQTKMVGDIELSFLDYSTSKRVRVTLILLSIQVKRRQCATSFSASKACTGAPPPAPPHTTISKHD